MRPLAIITAAVVLWCLGVHVVVRVSEPSEALEAWAQQAISESTEVAERAIEELRGVGPEGLRALFETHEGLAQRMTSIGRRPASYSEREKRLRHALETVAAQRDAHYSRLFWYTNLDEATQVATATGKPILSLRLLGDLRDEYSCANSRFFRTAYYANESLSKTLREDFVLHWETFLEIPRVHVEFPDGRSMERTITGNSLHLVLDSTGRSVDVIPGLYTPAEFASELNWAKSVAQSSVRLDGRERGKMLARSHAGEARRKAEQLRVTKLQYGQVKAGGGERLEERPTAVSADRLALGKSVVESSLVRSVALVPVPNVEWKDLSEFLFDSRVLDENSRRLMKSKSRARGASFLRVLEEFQMAMTQDSLRNKYELHVTVHDWFAAEDVPEDAGVLVDRVYERLFLMPKSDPWRGLAPEFAYTALEGDGLSE